MNYDEATLAQVEKIQKEVSVLASFELWLHEFKKSTIYVQMEEVSEYISKKEAVSCLTKEYLTDDAIYQTKIKVCSYRVKPDLKVT